MKEIFLKRLQKIKANEKTKTDNSKNYDCRQFACYILKAGTQLIDFNINWDIYS